MRRRIRIGLALPLLASACATLQERVAGEEAILAASGFHARAADTPQRAALLQRLPAHRVVLQPTHGRDLYLFADPLVCGCLYVGSAAAYRLYSEQMAQRRLADGQRLTAQVNPDPDWSLDGWDL